MGPPTYSRKMIKSQRRGTTPRDILKERTVTISLRVSESALKALQEDAKKQSVSLNTLANQMFVSYSDYDRYLEKFRMVKISTPTLKRIINAATDEAIVEAGRAA